MESGEFPLEKFPTKVKMWLILVVVLALVIVFCLWRSTDPTPKEHLGIPGSLCPDHCNCAVYTQDGQWIKCQRARMKGGCKPRHEDRVCRNAADGMIGVGQFKVGCCGSSCGHPQINIGRALQCTLENEAWRGRLHSCKYTGQDLRCHK